MLFQINQINKVTSDIGKLQITHKIDVNKDFN